MKNNYSRGVFVALSLMFSIVANAYDFLTDGICYNIIDEEKMTVEVTNYRSFNGKNNYSGDLVIPETVTDYGKKYSVTKIGDYAFQDCSELITVVIPGSVTVIGKSAFDRCEKLSEVSIPNSVTTIGNAAFWCCKKLINIDIPNSVTYIDSEAFEGCSELTSVTLPDSLNYISTELFSGCSSLASIDIPASVTSIAKGAFGGCESLGAVHISDLTAWCNIQFVYGSNPLSYAKNLYLNGEQVTDLVIPNGVIKINEYAFADCESLTSVTIPNSVKEIAYDSFSGCIGLNAIYINDLAAWCEIVFNGNNPLSYAKNLYLNGELITDLVIPDGVTSISYSAFNYCIHLTSVTIPNSVISIGSDAFSECTTLSDISIGGNLEYVGSDIFNNTEWYNKQPDGIVYLGNMLYKYKGVMPENTNVEIKEGTGIIAASAFGNCTGLISVKMPKSLRYIMEGTFYGCANLNAVHISDLAAWCNISEKYAYGENYSRNLYLNGELVTELVIPGNIERINDYAFYGISSITSVKLSNGVKTVGVGAFRYCSSLTTVTIPSSVTDFYSNAFVGCTSLTDIHINDLAAWCNIKFGSYVLYNRNLYLNGTLVEHLVIPANVETIGGYAFYGSLIKSVNVSSGVRNIGKFAFSRCENLTTVTLSNGVEHIGECAFATSTALNNVTIPNSVTKIDRAAFSGCTSITAMEIPNSVTQMEAQAFKNCTSLVKMTLPKSLETLGRSAFEGCAALTEIEIPDGVKTFGEYDYGGKIFYGCTSLAKVKLPAQLECVGYSTFNGCTSLTSVSLPNSVTTIGNSTFAGCTSLESVVIPKNISRFGSSTFSGCENLKTVINLSDSILVAGSKDYGHVAYYATKIINPTGQTGDFFFEDGEEVNTLVWYMGNEVDLQLPINYKGGNYAIGEEVFKNHTEATNVSVPNCVTIIGASAFEGCSNIESLYISSSIDSIGDNAFRGCENIYDIKVGAKKAITANENIFEEDVYNNASLYVPAGREFAYKKATPWNRFYIAGMDFTGVDKVVADDVYRGLADVYYDLLGRVVENPDRGIYIKNGKKVILK